MNFVYGFLRQFQTEQRYATTPSSYTDFLEILHKLNIHKANREMKLKC